MAASSRNSRKSALCRSECSESSKASCESLRKSIAGGLSIVAGLFGVSSATSGAMGWTFCRM